ncbi:MAG TPA: helix-turn-helix transcriptional regulator [Ohtaekwangia sp.]
MTKLGEYLGKRSVNKSMVSRKTGLSNQRLGELSTKASAKLRADELYLIALAIGANPCELLEYVCGDLTLKKEKTESARSK